MVLAMYRGTIVAVKRTNNAHIDKRAVKAKQKKRNAGYLSSAVEKFHNTLGMSLEGKGAAESKRRSMVCMYVCIYIYALCMGNSASVQDAIYGMFVCMCVCMYVCIYIYIHM